MIKDFKMSIETAWYLYNYGMEVTLKGLVTPSTFGLNLTFQEVLWFRAGRLDAILAKEY